MTSPIENQIKVNQALKQTKEIRVKLSKYCQKQQVEQIVEQAFQCTRFMEEHAKAFFLQLISKAIDSLPPGRVERVERVLSQTLRTFNNKMDDKERIEFLQVISRLPDHDLERIVDQFFQLMPPRSHRRGRKVLLQVIGALPSQEREQIVAATRQLRTSRINGYGLKTLVHCVSNLPSEERSEIVRLALLLITDEMHGQKRSTILYCIKNFAPDQRESIVNQIRQLMPHKTHGPERYQLLKAIHRLPADEKEQILTQAQPFITGSDDVDQMCAFLNAIAQLPAPFRVEKLHYIRSLNLPRDASLERIREESTIFRVPQSDITNQLISVLLKLEKWASYQPLEKTRFQYDDQPMVDFGGGIRDFITRFIPEVGKNLMLMHQGRYLPTISLSSISHKSQIKHYQVLGKIFALSINKNIPLGNHFHPFIFEMFYKLSENDFKMISSDGRSNSKELDQKLSTFLADQYLKIDSGEWTKIQEMQMDGVLAQPLQEAFGCTTKQELFNFITPIIQCTLTMAWQMRAHCKEIETWEDLCMKYGSAEELQGGIEGRFSKELMIASLQFEDVEEALKEKLNTWINQASEEKLKNFVFSVTGLKTLPVYNAKIRVHPVDTNGSPIFHTCSFRVDIPKNYKNLPQEEFNQILEAAISSSQNGFQII